MRFALISCLSMILAAASAGDAPPPGITVKPLQRTPLAGDATREVVMAAAEFAPGATMGRHTHHGDEYATVIEGTLELRVEGQAPKRIAAGEAYHNERDVAHETLNSGDTPARLISTFIIDKGRPIIEPVKAAQ